MVEIEIDGKKLTVEDGTSIIEAADEIGIYIPRFCYHRKLTTAANCRMCLVEVEKVGKPLPACATPVTPGMKVFTNTKKAIDAQSAVMEFLLINHPLDCPICDQGGECELQDLAMGFGRPLSTYDETKRSVFSDDIGSLIETEMTRCIQCTRCVRFGEEIAGLRELGVLNRGEKEEISTYVKHFLRSELSGNIIDLCPVGALTDKPSRYRGRGWEYREHAFVSPHDCVGTNMFLHSRGEVTSAERKVMRAVPRENDSINETWMSDRDRFSHHGFYHDTRIYRPSVKRSGGWIEMDWESALHETVASIQEIIAKQGAESVAGLASPISTVEELYLFQKLIRGIGSPHLDHRFRWQDFRDQHHMAAFPDLGMPIADMDKLGAALLVGSNIRFEQPILSHRLNQASLDGAKIMAINPMDYSFIFSLHEKMIASPHEITHALAEVAKAVLDLNNEPHHLLKDIAPSEPAKLIAQTLHSEEKAAIFLGEHALHHPHATEIRALVRLIARAAKATVGFLTEGANSAGAWLTGCVPHRGPAGKKVDQEGLDAKAMLTTDPKKVYFLLNLEPEFDVAYSAQALKVLKQAKCVVCLTPFVTEAMEEYANIILPITPFSESGGTYVNVEGRWQSFAPVSIPRGGAQPGWKVLRVLGNLFEFENFSYDALHEVRHEIKKEVDSMPLTSSEYMLKELPKAGTGLIRLAPWPIYRVDPIVRRSHPLQETLGENEAVIRINTKTAKRLNFQNGERIAAIQQSGRIVLPLVIDDRLADNTVFVAAALESTAGFGQTGSIVELKREHYE